MLLDMPDGDPMMGLSEKVLQLGPGESNTAGNCFVFVSYNVMPSGPTSVWGKASALLFFCQDLSNFFPFVQSSVAVLGPVQICLNSLLTS